MKPMRYTQEKNSEFYDVTGEIHGFYQHGHRNSESNVLHSCIYFLFNIVTPLNVLFVGIWESSTIWQVSEGYLVVRIFLPSCPVTLP